MASSACPPSASSYLFNSNQPTCASNCWRLLRSGS
ncbi:hypothetical protein [Pulveribacter sp.]